MEKTNIAFDPKVVVGLDVSKKHLDVVIHGRRSFRRFENTSEGCPCPLKLDHLLLSNFDGKGDDYGEETVFG